MKFYVRLRDQAGILHPFRVQENFTFSEKESAINEAQMLCRIYIASDYVVTDDIDGKEMVIWERDDKLKTES